MATNTAGTTARQLPVQIVHYLRKGFTFADTTAIPLTVGILPAGAQIIKPLSGVYVNIGFTAATNHRLDIGTTSNDDLYGVNLELANIGFIVLDQGVSTIVSVDTTITATPDLTGASNTAGSGEIIIAYVPDIDG